MEEKLKCFLTGPNDAIGGNQKFILILVKGFPVILKIQ